MIVTSVGAGPTSLEPRGAKGRIGASWRAWRERLMAMGEEDIADLKDEITRPPVAHDDAVRRPQTIEDRQTHPQKRDA